MSTVDDNSQNRKKKMRVRKRKAETYDTSDRFVASDDDNNAKPATKRTKASESNGKIGTASNVGGIPETKTDEEGNEFWEISKARRVGLSEFKGMTMVSVREYYEKDSKWLPGKKGITMTLEQFSTLVAALPQIEAALAEKGESVPRPQYDGAKPSKPDVAAEDDNDVEESEEEKKANFDATSDEDDD